MVGSLRILGAHTQQYIQSVSVCNNNLLTQNDGELWPATVWNLSFHWYELRPASSVSEMQSQESNNTPLLSQHLVVGVLKPGPTCPNNYCVVGTVMWAVTTLEARRYKCENSPTRFVHQRSMCCTSRSRERGLPRTHPPRLNLASLPRTGVQSLTWLLALNCRAYIPVCWGRLVGIL